MPTRIYLNNAGTSWPKPEGVAEAVRAVIEASPEESARTLERAEREVAEFFGIGDPARFVFTAGCTAALSLAVLDLPWNEGDVLLTSHLEHHALMRPISKLVAERGVRHGIVPYTTADPFDLDSMDASLRQGRVRLVACTMACNVSGQLLPAAEIVKLAHRHDALCLLDGAQVAGLLPVDLDALAPDLFAFAGHKAPLGPQGVGGLYVGPRVQRECTSASCGIGETGDVVPSYCDTGSVNLAAVAGLEHSLRWLRGRGVKEVGETSRHLADRLRRSLSEMPGVRLHGRRDRERSTAAVSLTHDRWSPAELEARLEDRGVIARAGLHCAPLAHEALGTLPGGTLRLSCGPFNTADQIDEAVARLGEMTSA